MRRDWAFHIPKLLVLPCSLFPPTSVHVHFLPFWWHLCPHAQGCFWFGLSLLHLTDATRGHFCPVSQLAGWDEVEGFPSLTPPLPASPRTGRSLATQNLMRLAPASPQQL